MRVLICIICSIFFISGSSQKLARNFSSQSYYYSEDPVLNLEMKKVEGSERKYTTHFPYSTCNLHLYEDSTFVFYYADAGHYKMAVGNYRFSKGTYVLDSDSLRTENAVSSPAFYKKYFKFKSPTALWIRGAAYFEAGDVLIPFYDLSKSKIELLPASQDLLKHQIQMRSFRSINYTANGKTVSVDFTGDSVVIVKLNSLWGFAILKSGSIKVYRTTPRGFNWYGMPGIEIVQTEPFIIYTVGEGRLYSYFSRDLNSKIHPLNFDKIQQEFKDKPEFVAAVEKEFGKNKPLNAPDPETKSYRVAELYKRSLSKDSVR